MRFKEHMSNLWHSCVLCQATLEEIFMKRKLLSKRDIKNRLNFYQQRLKFFRERKIVALNKDRLTAVYKKLCSEFPLLLESIRALRNGSDLSKDLVSCANSYIDLCARSSIDSSFLMELIY